MMKHALSAVAAATVFVLVAACSPPNIANSSAAAACADFAYAHCSRVDACSTIAIALRYPDLATCRALFTTNCVNAINAPSSMTPASVESCSTATTSPSWSCNDFLYGQNAPPQCTLQAGTRVTGAACAFSTQCQTRYCSIPRGSACGTCGALPAPGDSCANLTTCGFAQTCDAATQQCIVFSQSGGACSATQPCGVSFGCDATQTCQPQASTPNATCAVPGPGCNLYAGLTCNTASATCVTLQFGAPGDACGLVSNQYVPCGHGGVCVGGVCVASAVPTQACDIAAGPFCVPPSECVVTTDAGTSGTCQFAGATDCK